MDVIKTKLWASLSPGKRKLICWVLGLLLFYTIVGFFILPPIVRAVAVKQLSAQLDRKVSIQKVGINPFAFSTSIRGLLISDKDGQPFISWDEVYVRFDPWSVFSKAWTFGKITVTRPFIRAQMNQDYTFNFSDLQKKFTSSASGAKKPSKMLFVRVKELMVTNAELSVADFTVRTPFKRIVGPFDLVVRDFSTVPDVNSPYSLMGTTDAGENFWWRGFFCLTPLRSEGRILVYDITLNKFAPLYQDIVKFEIRSGDVGVSANYRFEWSPSNRVASVTNGAYGLHDFRLAEVGSTNDITEVFHYAMTDASLDAEAHKAFIGRMFADGAKLFIQRQAAGNFNVVELSKPKANAGKKPGGIELLLGAITNEVTILLTNQWRATIHQVSFTNCAAHLEDFAYSRPATLNLDDFALEVTNISNIPNTNLDAALSVLWNTNGTIRMKFLAQISPPTADVHFDLKNLNLNTLDPYLESQFNLLIPDASFGLNGDVHIRTPPGHLPNVMFHGETWLNDFRTIDGVTAEDLLKWSELRIIGIDANLNPPAVSIKKIFVDSAGVNAVIETNRTINLLLALQPANTNAVAAAKPAVAAKPKGAKKSNAIPFPGMPEISISSVVVSNAEVRFVDRSLTPNVNMTIQQAGGTIDGLSSSGGQQADVNINALVDGVGPVKVIGVINPFNSEQTNDLHITTRDVDLVPTSPYVGKFAGYRLVEGNLNLDLSYQLVGRKLDSQNNITLDQFTFGDKVDSPDATKLPVRLAIDILKDRDGKIVLDVPVQGSLDDPKFRIGKVVWHTILNLLTKVATSPFSLLGAAFGGGGDELSYQDFEPASVNLTDVGTHKLDVIAKALYARPGLQLQISGSIDPVNDPEGLRRAAFEKELQNRQWQSLSRSKRAITTPDEIVLTPRQRAHWVKKLYNEAVASGKINHGALASNKKLAAIAALVKSPEAKTTKLGQLLVQKPTTPNPSTAPVPAPPKSKLPPLTDPKEALLVEIIPVSESDLEALAINRARTVRAYILQTGKAEAHRLFLAQNQGGGLRQDGSRVYLELN